MSESALVQVFFRGTQIGAWQLGPRAGAAFTIGSGAGADAPVPDGVIVGARHALVAWTRSGLVLRTTPSMRIESAGPVTRIQCGASPRTVTYVVELGGAAPSLPRPRTGLRWAEQRYNALSAALIGLLLVAVLGLPLDRGALAGGMFDLDRRLVRGSIQATEHVKPPTWPVFENAALGPGINPGSKPPGRAGNHGGPLRNARLKQTGRHGPRNLTRDMAMVRARAAGVLGLLADEERKGGVFKALLGDRTAFGTDDVNLFGGLVGSDFAEQRGIGGIGVTGTGACGCGDGSGGVGVGALGTLGRGTLGRLARKRLAPPVLLGTREARAPDVTAAEATVRGGIDDGIVRRVVRRHLTDVRSCYEEGLARVPHLAGRLVVQFIVDGGGRVTSAFTSDSELGDARVESCISGVVRRWAFPGNLGSSLTVVSYPFVLAASGS